ncbi:MAG: ATP-binding protein [Oscillatoriales cyanobacterium]|nr:MAG: ATP-binding protein [Oscillatoriales cyanobacterium]
MTDSLAAQSLPLVGPTLIVMIGPPGCGKSTWAQTWQAAAPNRVRVSTDEIRARQFGNASVQGNWGIIWREVCTGWQQAIASGQDVVYDATNADRKSRRQVIQTAHALGFGSVLAAWVQTPVSQCQQWNTQRDRQVPAEVIDRMAQQLDRSPPCLDEGFDGIAVIEAIGGDLSWSTPSPPSTAAPHQYPR